MAKAQAPTKRLGRGLSSLLGEVVAVATPAKAETQTNTKTSSGLERDERPHQIISLPVGTIVASPFQPRRMFDQGGLERLAASIRAAGVMQPILVRRVGGGGAGHYELVAGERRWRAVQLAGLDVVPAVVADIGDEQAAEWALIENMQREELGAMERAFGLKSLADRFGLTHAQIADRVGIDRSSVTNLIRLTELEDPIRALLDERRLSVGHGKALLGLAAGPARIALAERAAARNWSVRQLEQEVTRAGTAGASGGDGERSLSDSGVPGSVSRLDLERQLGEYLGTKVQIRSNRAGTKGRMLIEFYDLDHFDGLMSRIGFRMR